MMNWNSDDTDVLVLPFLESEPHRNYLGHVNKSKVVLVHFKCLHMCSTHFIPIKTAGVFCNRWSSC